MRAEIAVFARAPRPGRTKTRLIPALGPEGAAALYAAFLDDTLAKLEGLDARLWAASEADAPALELALSLPRAVPLAEPDVVRQRHFGLRALGREQDVSALRARFGAALVEIGRAHV